MASRFLMHLSCPSNMQNAAGKKLGAFITRSLTVNFSNFFQPRSCLQMALLSVVWRLHVLKSLCAEVSCAFCLLLWSAPPYDCIVCVQQELATCMLICLHLQDSGKNVELMHSISYRRDVVFSQAVSLYNAHLISKWK